MISEISTIYCAVHLNYNSLITIGEGPKEINRQLNPESQDRYSRILRRQNELILHSIQNPTTALIYVPFISGRGEMYPELSESEQWAIDMEIDRIQQLQRLLGHRLCIVDDSRIKPHTGNPSLVRLWRALNDYQIFMHDIQYLADCIQFQFNKDAEIIAFGEYTDQCVPIYGQYIAKLLDINKFRIDELACVANHELVRIY